MFSGGRHESTLCLDFSHEYVQSSRSQRVAGPDDGTSDVRDEREGGLRPGSFEEGKHQGKGRPASFVDLAVIRGESEGALQVRDRLLSIASIPHSFADCSEAPNLRAVRNASCTE